MTENNAAIKVVKGFSPTFEFKSPLPIYSDEMALLRKIAVEKLRASSSIIIPMNFDNNLFTTAKFAEDYQKVALAFDPKTINAIYADTFSASTNYNALCDAVIKCPRELHSRITQAMGMAIKDLGQEISDMVKDINNFAASEAVNEETWKQRKEMRWQEIKRKSCIKSSAASVMKGYSVTKGSRDLQVVIHALQRFFNILGRGDEAREMLHHLMDDIYQNFRRSIVDLVADRQLADIFGEGRGERLLTLFGFPGEPVQRGDQIGLTFGLVTIQKPRRLREGWASTAVNSKTTFSLRCICGKEIQRHVSWCDVQRGRSFQCGCCGLRTYGAAWKTAAIGRARTRYTKKKSENMDVDFRFYSFDAFLDSVGLPWRDGLDLSRIGDNRNSGIDYAPGQCFWEDEGANRAKGAQAKKAKPAKVSREQKEEAARAAITESVRKDIQQSWEDARRLKDEKPEGTAMFVI